MPQDSSGSDRLVTKLRDEHGGTLELRDRVVGREPLRRIVVAFEEPQDRRIALGTDRGPSVWERTCYPRFFIVAVYAQDVVDMLADLRGTRGVDAVGVPKVDDESIRDGRVLHPRFEFLKIGFRLGVALPCLRSVAADDLLETAVLGHGQASS